jgi:hypothetical protein
MSRSLRALKQQMEGNEIRQRIIIARSRT